MNKSSRRGIFLSIALLFSIIVILIPSDAYAEEINVKSTALEETTILEITNNSDKKINTLKIWAEKNVNFQSFKTEKGWIGENTPQGVIIFTSSESIKIGEIVKFGIKTDKPTSGINWKVLDEETNQIDMGKTLSKELTSVIQNPHIISNQNDNADIFSESIFRIIPEKPNNGSTIRIVGEKFQPSQVFDLYIDTKKIGSFSTDINGQFISTMKIPVDQKSDRVDFKILNKEKIINKISLRLGENNNYLSELQNANITIGKIPNILHRGNSFEVTGTGNPNSSITIEIGLLGKEVINSRIAHVNNNGNWKLDKPITVALDAEFGKYSIKISDGRQNTMKQWSVISNKVILIETSNLKYELGDIIKINGTALPNIPIEVSIENPLGKIAYSDIIQLDSTGQIEFGYKTTQSEIKGTYKIIVNQKNEKEVLFVGMGQLPKMPIEISMNKTNYKTTDTAIISLIGKENEIVNLIIIDPSTNQKGETISIALQSDGLNTYDLDLTGYSSGVYSAVISKGSTESKAIFTVGLQTGVKEIKIQTTKQIYQPGEAILILGDTAENSIIEIIMLDPDGNKIKEKETFSNKEGRISDNSFKIPTDANSGIWKIGAKSGSHFNEVEIEVLSELNSGIQIIIEEGVEVVGIGKTIQIKLAGVTQSAEINIKTNEDIIIDTLSINPSKQGEINVSWIVPKEMEPGIYKITVKDAVTFAENTFVVP